MRLTKIPEGSFEIIKVLQSGNMSSVEELEEKIDTLNTSTLRYAIRRLLEVGIIQSTPDLVDMRTVKYRIASSSELQKVLLELPDKLAKEIENFLYRRSHTVK